MMSTPVEQQLWRKFATMYNNARGGTNTRVMQLMDLSVAGEKKGLCGQNVIHISQKWQCGYEQLKNNTTISHDAETLARVEAIHELSACLHNENELSDFSQDEIKDLIYSISIL